MFYFTWWQPGSGRPTVNVIKPFFFITDGGHKISLTVCPCQVFCKLEQSLPERSTLHCSTPKVGSWLYLQILEQPQKLVRDEHSSLFWAHPSKEGNSLLYWNQEHEGNSYNAINSHSRCLSVSGGSRNWSGKISQKLAQFISFSLSFFWRQISSNQLPKQ